ncbi:DoxX family protein [Spirosoma sp. BT702]|uniref:DoxX family protein n=1 Tax=Spirosoma profusum TaxID=2771354 RepID=A0A927AR52_9BACT|nr:DoxX family protein [Spirosoma profusum]MBD2701803.1 DoxX family protein [Spirosoma profusum]
MLQSFFVRFNQLSFSALLLRITMVVILFPHGSNLMLGWFGGKGFTQSVEGLSSGAGLPYFIAVLVVMLQFFGSLALGFGLLTRYFAFATMVLFIGMIPYHTEYGFFMNWFGKQQGEGFEYHLLVLGICAALVVSGAGQWSVDGFLQKKKWAFN